MTHQRRGYTKQASPAWAELAPLFGTAVLMAAYAVLRYGGLWGEVDTQAFTQAIQTVVDTGTLKPEPGYFVYSNGYGYPALAMFLMNVSGLDLPTLQIYGSVLLMVWVIFPAWLLYRELTGTSHGATLATVILLAQPEFLFPILRGTHEKFTRGLMLLCMYLLIRSMRSRHKLNQLVALVLIFYLAAFSLITFNVLFATSFILALSLALVLSQVVMRRSRLPSHSAQSVILRLVYVTIALLVLAFVFIFYIYEPAHHSLRMMQSVVDQLAALFLDVEKVSNPYAVISTGWISLPVYLTVSIANWLLLAGSAAIWIWQGICWLQHRRQLQTESELLLWAFYGAFAFMSALSIVVDVSGAIAQNLQHRLFPSFAMLAVPMVAKQLMTLRPRRALARRLAYTGLWVGMGLLVVLSTFKATNEPLLSNKWLFYLHAEARALDWAGDKLADRTVWVGFDERLSVAMIIRTGTAPRNVQIDRFDVGRDTRNFLISDVIRNRSLRISVPLPIETDDLVTFDNGQVQIYHRRPHTPYQR